MKSQTFLAAALLAASCSAKPPIDTKQTLSVDQVMQNLDELNGRTVKVIGFLPGCGGYDCGLFGSQRQARDFWAIANDPKRKEKLPKFMEIGVVSGFDAKASRYAGHYVIVRGRVTNECKIGCLDRGPNLVPIDLTISPQQSPETRH